MAVLRIFGSFEIHQFAAVGTAIGDVNCDASWSPTAFVLPDVISVWAAGNGNIDTGVRLEDINGDGLADVLQGWNDNSLPTTICIWLNTGCGW